MLAQAILARRIAGAVAPCSVRPSIPCGARCLECFVLVLAVVRPLWLVVRIRVRRRNLNWCCAKPGDFRSDGLRKCSRLPG